MEIETLRIIPPLTKNFRSSDCTFLGFNLPSLISAMKQSYAWANGELKAKILLKSPEKQVILTALHEGIEIKSFQSNDSVTFQIIQGRLRVHIRRDTVTLHEGQLMTIDEKTKYRLTTGEETVFLLTISNSITRALNN